MAHSLVVDAFEVVILLSSDHEGGQIGGVDGQENHGEGGPDASHKSVAARNESASN